MPLSALRNLPQERQDARRERAGMAPAVQQDYTGRDAAGELLTGASLATMPVPILGDVMGLAADARMYQTRPEERTLGNYALSALGVLPFVPSAAAVRAAAGISGEASKAADDLAALTAKAPRALRDAPQAGNNTQSADSRAYQLAEDSDEDVLYSITAYTDDDAFVVADANTDGTFSIKESGVPEQLRGSGVGIGLYESLLGDAFKRGAPRVASDVSVSKDAQRIYSALQRRGYNVQQNPSAVVDPDSGALFAEGGVYTIMPASAAPSPLEGTLDMSQAARMQRAADAAKELAKRGIDMSTAARMQRAAEQGFDVDMPVYQSKTEYELAHEVAQRNAALPVEQGGLGLATDNTAMDRANAMGFDTPAYHGTNNDIAKFDTGRSGAKTGNPNAWLGIFTTPNAQEASRYAEAWGKEGGNVMPLVVRSGSTYQMPYKELDDLAMAPYRAMMADPNYNPDSVVKFGDMAGQKAAAERLRGYDQTGIDAVALHREKLLADGYDTAVVLKGKPMEEIITFDPANIRSRFAAFDPTKRGSRDLMAGAAATGVGLSALRNINNDEPPPN